MARGAARINLIADASGVRRGTREAERDISRLSRVGSASFGTLKLGALAAGAAVGGTFVAAMRTGISELLEAEKVSAQTAAAIRSTGGAAGVTQKHIEGMSGSLQALTGVEDDAIQSAANLGLAFTNVRNRGEGVNAVYDRMLRATVDISARTGKDLDPVMRQLGRALDDPARGMTALSRIGVRFTEETRERVRELAAEGRTLEAQKLILAEVEKRYEGAGRAAGQTMRGQLERAKRSFEDISQQLTAELLPVFTDLLRAVQRNMPAIRSAIERVSDVVRDVVKFVRAVIDEDWDEAWRLAEKAVRVALDAIVTLVRGIGSRLLSAAKAAGLELARGLVQGIDDGLARIPGSGAVRRLLGFDPVVRGAPLPVVDPDGRAMGGFLPGQYRGVDDRVILAASGEAVLTPEQQAMIPGGRGTLAQIFARTGGRIGGDGFAAGGWVHPAPGTRRGGGPGGGTHSFSAPPNNWQSDMAWDLMGSDGTPVVATHAGVITATRPFSSDPRFWGHAAYLSVPGGQFYYKHLKSLSVRAGQRVEAGDVIGVLGAGVNGGPHLHLGADSRSLLDKAVNAPPGRKGGRDGHETPEDEETPAPARRLSPALRRSLTRGGQAPALSASDRISARDSDDSLVERRAGNSAERSAREGGVTNPEKLAAVRERAINDTRIADLRKDRRDLIAEIRRVRARIATLRTDKGKAYRRLRKARTQQAQNREIGIIRGINEELSAVRQEERALIREVSDVDNQLALLGDEQADLNATISGLPDQEPTGDTTSVDTSTPDTATPAGPRTIDSRAGISDGRALGAINAANNENMILREFIGTAFGPGDLGAGGAGPVGAATGGRWVPIVVDAGSLSAAVGSSIGTKGYVGASLVPSGA